TVTKVPLRVWGPNLTMIYGGTVPAITPAYTGFVNGDTATTLSTLPNVAPTCNASVTNTTPAGSYPTVCSGASDPNYVITYTNGVFTVSPAALTITPAPLTLQYNTPIPSTFTLNPTGLLGTDTLASLGMSQPTPVACTTTAKQT